MKTNKEQIIEKAKSIYSNSGQDALSMRRLATELGIQQSDIYNYFSSKDSMLKEIFDITAKDLGVKRKNITPKSSFEDDLKDRIHFQFDNALDVNYILKYFFQNKSTFPKNEKGYVPSTAYRHIEEVLEKWINILSINGSVSDEAKIITHAINGFVLEYFPNTISEQEKSDLVDKLASFISRSLKKH